LPRRGAGRDGGSGTEKEHGLLRLYEGAKIIEVEAEVVEKLQDVIPATGQTGPSEALEHRLEPRGLRPRTACNLSPGYGKQEKIVTLERARRG